MNKRDCYFIKQHFVWNRQNAINKTGNLEDVINPPTVIFCYSNNISKYAPLLWKLNLCN